MIAKVGNPTYNDTSYAPNSPTTIYDTCYDVDGFPYDCNPHIIYQNNVWNSFNIIQYGSNNQSDGNGLLVTMPTTKSILWIRTLGDRWNKLKVYDSSGKQFGNWTGGFRNLAKINPDGGIGDTYYNVHEWMPINVTGHNGTLYVIATSSPTTNDFWLSGIAFTTNPDALTWQSAVNYHWAVNGGPGLAWNSIWNSDNLANINPGTTATLMVPVVGN